MTEMPNSRVRSHKGDGRIIAAARWPADGRGFSLIELTVSILVLSIVMGALFQFMSMMSRRYTQAQRTSGISQTGKSVMELLTMDVGQAGYYPGRNTTTSAAVTTVGAQSVTLTDTTGIFPGSVIIVDTGMNQEPVPLSAVTHSSNTVTGLFRLDHLTGVPVRLSEVPYPEGILAPIKRDSTGSLVVDTTGSNATTLKLMGDFRDDGTLRYVEYRYRSATSSATACSTPPCALWRSDSCVPGTATGCTITTQSAAVKVADNLMNTATGGVFEYLVLCRAGTLPTLAYVTYLNSSLTAAASPCFSLAHSCVLGVVVNLEPRTQVSVERGAGGPVKIAVQKTLAPRNIRHAMEVSLDGLQRWVPEKPTTVPLAP